MRDALIKAVVGTAVWAVAMFIPGLNIIGLIIVMLPLSILNDMGLHGLGRPNNGFFVPSDAGYVLGAVIIWLALFVWFLRRDKSKDRGF